MSSVNTDFPRTLSAPSTRGTLLPTTLNRWPLPDIGYAPFPDSAPAWRRPAASRTASTIFT